REVMVQEDLEDTVLGFLDDILEEIYAEMERAGKDPEERSQAQGILKARLEEVFGLHRILDLEKEVPEKEQAKEKILSILGDLKDKAGGHYQEILRFFLLESLDRYWKEHLLNMDHLKEGIGLRGYGQKDPKQEYKREGFELFQELLYLIKENTLKGLCHIRLREVSQEQLQHEEQPQELQLSGGQQEESATKQPYKRKDPKVGRNDPCPCGSGRKYKKCCGA
ncbi:MAG: SEC-C metal-binding domain-containing protein, partial [Desulfohalobiaceae bacterium]